MSAQCTHKNRAPTHQVKVPVIQKIAARIFFNHSHFHFLTAVQMSKEYVFNIQKLIPVHSFLFSFETWKSRKYISRMSESQFKWSGIG